MKNKGFTLIELLAVIVILAIIALIATPVILGIINDSRTQAKKRSAEMVFTGVQYAYTAALYGSAQGTNVETNPVGSDIAAKFTADNAFIDGTPTDTEFKIKTSDGAYCLVTINTTAYDVKVKCTSNSDYSGEYDLLAEKSAISVEATNTNS